MNIEIKFRGLSIMGDWVFGLPSTETTLSETPDYIAQFLSGRKYGQYCIKVNPKSITQYIRKGKNDKEVYKGDIVRMQLLFSSYEFQPPYHPTGHDGYGTIDCIGEIIFSESSFVFKCKKVLKETSTWHDEYNLTKHFTDKVYRLNETIEVIGNIFENPELLK